MGFLDKFLGREKTKNDPPQPDVEKNTTAAYAEFEKGLACFGPELRQRALQHFRAAIAIKPDEGVFHLRIAATLEALGQKDEAKREYRESIRLIPEDGTPFFCLGNMLRDEGDISGATESYRNALRLQLDQWLRAQCTKALTALQDQASVVILPQRPAKADNAMSEEIYVRLPPSSNLMEAAVKEHQYLAEHPCECGGAWRMARHSQDTMECRCSKCGRLQVFVFG